MFRTCGLVWACSLPPSLSCPARQYDRIRVCYEFLGRLHEVPLKVLLTTIRVWILSFFFCFCLGSPSKSISDLILYIYMISTALLKLWNKLAGQKLPFSGSSDTITQGLFTLCPDTCIFPHWMNFSVMFSLECYMLHQRISLLSMSDCTAGQVGAPPCT